MHVFRRDELMEVSVRLEAPLRDHHQLQAAEKTNALRQDWLHA